MEKPLISVVIPTYNDSRFITEAINSVLDQDYPKEKIELIVVNDGSTDNTPEILNSFGEKIKVINQENQGQSVGRNVGVQNAKGDIIGFLDADDLWPKDHIKNLLQYMIGADSVDIVRGYTKYFKYLGTPNEEWTEPSFKQALLGSCLCKKSIFEKVGWFDPDMRQGQDFDWASRIEEAECSEKTIPETTLFYRRHENNLTNDLSRVKRGQTETLMKRLLRLKNKNK